jgi:hypothetical protein
MYLCICHILGSEIEKCGGKPKGCLLYSSAIKQPCLQTLIFANIERHFFLFEKNNEMEFLPLKRPSNGQNQHQVVFHGQNNQNSNHAKGKMKKK